VLHFFTIIILHKSCFCVFFLHTFAAVKSLFNPNIFVMKKIFAFLLVACFSATLFAQIEPLEVPRYVLVEGFSSSSCPPCNAGNVNLKNVLTQHTNMGGNHTLIKYQMSWPGNGDPYYTAEGGTRRSFYGVNAVPWVAMDGINKSVSLGNVLAAEAVPSYLYVSGNYTVTGQTVSATINIKPTVDITVGNNLRLYVAIVEKVTNNNWQTVPNQSNGEKIFYQIMKKFMPNASGIVLGNLTACELVTHELSWEFKGNYRLPNNALSPINHDIEHSVESFDNLEVIAWVQDASNRKIYNSCTAIKGNFFTANFDVNIEDRGTISASIGGTPFESGGLLAPGTIIDFIAESNSTYYIKGWKQDRCEWVDGGGKASNTFSITVDNSLTITTIFIKDCGINFEVINGNGALSASMDGNPVNPGDVFEEGSSIEFTALPIEGYKVKEWKLNGTVVAGNISNNYSLALNDDSNVTVEFMEIPPLPVTVVFNVINGNGTLSAIANGKPITSGCELAIETAIEFTAAPDEGYIVKEWKHNDEVVADNTTLNFSIIVSEDETVTVEYKKEEGINVNNLLSVELYPNPVENELIISNAEQIQKIIISNTLGQIVKEEVLTGKNIVVISTQNFPNGIFFITMKSFEGYEITKKIVKQ